MQFSCFHLSTPPSFYHSCLGMTSLEKMAVLCYYLLRKEACRSTHMPLFSYQSEMRESLGQTVSLHIIRHMVSGHPGLFAAAAHRHADGACAQHRYIHDRIAKGDGIRDATARSPLTSARSLFLCPHRERQIAKQGQLSFAAPSAGLKRGNASAACLASSGASRIKLILLTSSRYRHAPQIMCGKT